MDASPPFPSRLRIRVGNRKLTPIPIPAEAIYPDESELLVDGTAERVGALVPDGAAVVARRTAASVRAPVRFRTSALDRDS